MQKVDLEHPSYYVGDRKYEPKDVIRDWGLSFNLGNAVKYISRAGRKDNIIEDLEKAKIYIQFEIDAINEEKNKMTDSIVLSCADALDLFNDKPVRVYVDQTPYVLCTDKYLKDIKDENTKKNGDIEGYAGTS